MVKIGYQASHEQFAPSELLAYVKLAADSGFDFINSSDHFFPWSTRQGHSGYTFAWLGAAMQMTSIPFSAVCSPGQRYHPAIVAQAIATLCELYPQRLSIALGSGEALNECITGEIWPAKNVRNARLLECYNIINDLLNGKTVSHNGLVKVADAKLYTLPTHQPLLMGAALSAETAAWMGSWAPGLVTTASSTTALKEIVQAFRTHGGAGKPVYLKVQLAYAHTDEEALTTAHDQWRNNIFQGTVLGDLRTVEQFDALGELVTPDEVAAKVRVSSDLKQHTDWLLGDLELGVDHLILHQVGRNQQLFIQDFAREVLPKLNTRKYHVP